MLKQQTQTLVEMPPLFSWIKLLYTENIIEWHQLFDAHKKKLLETSPSLWSALSHLIAPFGAIIAASDTFTMLSVKGWI